MLKSIALQFAMCLHVTVLSGVCSTQQPAFKSIPTTVKTSENDTVLLPCYVDNLGLNIVRWWWEDKLLADSSDPKLTSPPRVTMWPNNTLQVSELKAEDTGEYTCQVVREEPWGPIEQVHAIEVLYPPSVSPIPADGMLEVTLGEDVHMACQAAGVPQPIVTWSTKGVELQLLDNRPKLRFRADNRSLSGVYECSAMNGVGEPARATIELKILYPPEVTADHPWVHAAPNVRVELVCRITADPDAKVVWLLGDKPVTGSARIVQLIDGDRHSLLLRNVLTSDFGHYTCLATNDIGHNQQIIQLSGVANPAVFKIESRPPSDNNYTLIWEVDSYSAIIEYILFFRRFQGRSLAGTWAKLIIPSDSYSAGPLNTKSFTLTGLQSATVYEVMVQSRNRYGWSRSSQVFRFATEGADLNDYEMSVNTDANPEENTIPGVVAAIFNERNAATKKELTIAFLLVVNLLLVAINQATQ